MAALELPTDSWKDLLPTLIGHVTSAQSSPALRCHTLESLGLICEQLDPSILCTHSDALLTAIISGLRQTVDMASRVAAAQSLLVALPFVNANLQRPNELTAIMQSVCEATVPGLSEPGNDDAVVLASTCLECLSNLAIMCHEQMREYLQGGVDQLLLTAMTSPQPSIALQAIEWWSSLAEFETYSLPADYADRLLPPFLPSLLPVLLPLMVRSEEQLEDMGAEEDEWNVPMAAGTAIGLIAEAVGDALVHQPIIEQFLAQLEHGNACGREAALMLLGSLLDGPSTEAVGPLLAVHFGRCLNALADPAQPVGVQDTAAWVVGRVCDFFHAVLDAQQANRIVECLLGTLGLARERPGVATNCCWSLMTLLMHLGSSDPEDVVPSHYLSAKLPECLQTLINCGGMAGENRLRSAAFEAIAGILSTLPQDQLSLLPPIVEWAIGEWHTGSVPLMHLTTVLQAAYRRMARVPDHERILGMLLNKLQERPGEMEDLIILLDTMIPLLEQSVLMLHVRQILSPLFYAIGQYSEATLVQVSLGALGDLARSLGENNDALTSHSQSLMEVIFGALRSNDLSRMVKVHCFTCLADCIMALGQQHFAPFLPATLDILMQASSILCPSDLDDDDFGGEEWEWWLDLRQALLECATALEQSMPLQNAQVTVLWSMLDQTGQLLLMQKPGALNESMLRVMVGLLGDLAQAYRSQIRQAPSWVSAMFALRGDLSPSTLSLLQWAQSLL